MNIHKLLAYKQHNKQLTTDSEFITIANKLQKLIITSTS